MSIEAIKQAIEALNEAVAFREGGRQKAIDAINALRTAIQQAEPKHRHWSEALADDLTESGDIQTNTHPAPGVPDGWQLVPIEPTAEMLQAALKVATPGALRAAWARMLAASHAQKGGE